MKLLKIKPCDNTFFRAGNIFRKEVSSVIQTKNIAYPSTFFGAIFTAILASNDIFREKFLGKRDNKDHLNILNIKQIYLYDEKQGDTYIPSPKDIFIGNDIKYGKYKKLNEGQASISYPYYLEEPDGNEIKRADHYYVNIRDFFEKYIYKVFKNTDFKHEDDIFIKNFKTGISLDKSTRNVIESCLYTIEETEFKNSNENYWSNDWNFVVEYSINNDFVKKHYGNLEIEDLEKGYLKLGGESKVCSYEIINNKNIDDFRARQKEYILKPGEKVKVIFTSDSYFKESFKKISNDKIKVQALVNDKPIYIGGFDLAKNREKTMYKGYSAGTIILLQNTSQSDIKINEYLSEKITGNFIDGFNQCVNGFNQYIYVKENENENEGY